jgi:hypothetical protein
MTKKERQELSNWIEHLEIDNSLIKQARQRAQEQLDKLNDHVARNQMRLQAMRKSLELGD